MLVYNRNKDGACSTAENDSYPCSASSKPTNFGKRVSTLLTYFII